MMRIFITIFLILAFSSSANARLRIVPVAGVTQSEIITTYQRIIDKSYVGTSDRNLKVALVECDREVIACLLIGRYGNWYMRFPDVGYLNGPEYDPAEWISMQIIFLHEAAHYDDIGVARRAGSCRRIRIKNCVGGDLSYRLEFANFYGWTLRDIREVGGIAAAWRYEGEFVPLIEAWADTVSFCATYPNGVPENILDRYSGYGYDLKGADHRNACDIVFKAARNNGWD